MGQGLRRLQSNPMSDRSQGEGWWLANDGKWYPPESRPASPSPAAASGLVGRPRSVGLTILLAIVTLGIWPIFWSYSNGEELKRYGPAGFGGGLFLVLHLFVHPVIYFLFADEVGKLYTEAGEEPPIRPSGACGSFFRSSETSFGMCAYKRHSTRSG